MKNVEMIFEDDDEMDDQRAGSVASGKTNDSLKTSRVSGRAKKIKEIFDPSLNNGPVHKRKIEALEKLNRSTETKPPSKPKLEVVEAKPKSPTKSRSNVPAKLKIAPESQSKPDLKKRPVISKSPVAKEPSKRIQERRPHKTNETSTLGGLAYSQFLSSRLDSASGNSSDDYEKVTTTTINRLLPDVRKWSQTQVYDYFTTKLDFNADAARIFIEEEIDGASLLLLRRSDIVTEKFSQLKLGTALKLWSQILMIQTGSNDPTQSWK